MCVTRNIASLRFIFAAFFVATACWPASGFAEEKNDEIVRISKQLGELILNYDGDFAKIAAGLGEVREKLNTAEKKHNLNNFLISRSQELAIAIGDEPPISDAFQAQAVETLKKLEHIEMAVPRPAIIRRASELVANLNQTKVARSDTAVRTALKTLMDKLELGESEIAEDAVTNRATSLTRLLTDANSAKAIRSSKAAGDALAALRAPLVGFTDELKPTVYVVEAIFGDLRNMGGSVRNRERTCNATDAMRAECMGDTECGLPSNHATALCAFDPVPQADLRYKALVVSYACLPSNNRDWNAFADKPVIANSKIKTAVLRSSLSRILCAPPKAAAGSAGN